MSEYYFKIYSEDFLLNVQDWHSLVLQYDFIQVVCLPFLYLIILGQCLGYRLKYKQGWILVLTFVISLDGLFFFSFVTV